MNDASVTVSQSAKAGSGGSADGQTPEVLVALPVQTIETASGVILKRGCVEMMVAGERAIEAIQTVFGAMAAGGATAQTICERFAAPDRAAAGQLIQELRARRIVVPAGSDLDAPQADSHLDVFYWHFGTSTAEINRRLNAIRIAIVGVNHVSRQLAGSLSTAGVTNVEIVDDPLFRNLSLFDTAGQLLTVEWRVAVEPRACDAWAGKTGGDTFDCLVATSDFGGLQAIRSWNELCLRLNRPFLPVFLQDLVGYVGPLVIPGETACFECFVARWNSNRSTAPTESLSETMAFDGQHVAAFHPAMASVLGDLAAIELTKFYSRALPLWKVGSVMEVNLLAGRIDSRKVLRVPRCRACSPLRERSSTSVINNSVASRVIEE